MALILLDAGLVGILITEANGRNAALNTEVEQFRAWYEATAGTIHEFAITDLTVYEVKRGLLFKGAPAKLQRLDEMQKATFGIQIDLHTWECAAQLWATVRHQGKPTADPLSLDGDAILAAVAVLLAKEGETVFVATTNLRHLVALGAEAQYWRDIPDSPGGV